MSEIEWQSVETSHPAWMLERWTKQYGVEEAVALASSNNKPPVTYLRPGSSTRSANQIAAALRQQGIETRPGDFLKSSFAVERGNVARTDSIRNGEIVIQDEASQIVPHLLDVRPCDAALDLCAAPGNKTGLLAQWVGEKGRVIACDIHLHRLRQLAMPPGLTKIHRVVLDGEQALPFTAMFDRILVDAPCSGTGTLRRNPELKWRLKPADIPALAEKQVRLLGNAAANLKPGGRIVYSTCSVEQEENQGVVGRFLAAHPGFRLLPVRDDLPRLNPSFNPAGQRLLAGDFFETSPARNATDGFFAAILGREL
jgi:16S rRNA (cytosine967-C5)-methyltransferase